jgi:hypothetical protein
MSVFLISFRDEIDFAISRFNLPEEEACHLVQCLSLITLTNSNEYVSELHCLLNDTRLEDFFQLSEGMELMSNVNVKLGDCLGCKMYDLNERPNAVMFINETDLMFG